MFALDEGKKRSPVAVFSSIFVCALFTIHSNSKPSVLRALASTRSSSVGNWCLHDKNESSPFFSRCWVYFIFLRPPIKLIRLCLCASYFVCMFLFFYSPGIHTASAFLPPSKFSLMNAIAIDPNPLLFVNELIRYSSVFADILGTNVFNFDSFTMFDIGLCIQFWLECHRWWPGHLIIIIYMFVLFLVEPRVFSPSRHPTTSSYCHLSHPLLHFFVAHTYFLSVGSIFTMFETFPHNLFFSLHLSTYFHLYLTHVYATIQKNPTSMKWTHDRAHFPQCLNVCRITHIRHKHGDAHTTQLEHIHWWKQCSTTNF